MTTLIQSTSNLVRSIFETVPPYVLFIGGVAAGACYFGAKVAAMLG